MLIIGWKCAIYNDASNQYAEVNYNFIEYAEGGHVRSVGYWVHDSESIGDTILWFRCNGSWTVMVVRFQSFSDSSEILWSH